MTNVLYYGDNLDVMREHVPDESVDLVYLDPPFNSNANYNVLFRSPRGEAIRAQSDVFEDTWHWGEAAELAFHEVMAGGGSAAGIVRALRGFFGESDMMAYLTNMTVRLEELRRVLKQTGSLFIHCDPTASHYLKVILDAIFGPGGFVNEIVWQRATPKGLAFTKFPSNHDVILYFRRGKTFTWNPQYLPHREEYVEKYYSLVDPNSGRRFQATSLLNPNKNRPNLRYEFHGHTRVWRWTKERMLEAERNGLIYLPANGGVPREKRYLDEQEGVPVTSTWTDIPPINSQARERLGFATQKPIKLLQRIIECASNEGDVVLDPFCGCGTAVHAAENLRRQWIGIDITHVAIQIIEGRFQAELSGCDYRVVGRPIDLAGVRHLAQDDKHEFQLWVADRLGAAPEAIKKGPDRGIDGLVWFLKSRSDADFAILSVKGGEKVGVGMIRDLRGTVERENAGAGIFVCLTRPTRDMIAEAAAAGLFETIVGTFPRIQIMTVEDILDGRRPNLPPTYDFATLLTLPRATGKARKARPDQLRKQLAMLLPLVNKNFEDLEHLSPADLALPERRAEAG